MFPSMKMMKWAIPLFALFFWASVAQAQLTTPTDSGLGGQNSVRGTVLTPEGARLATRIPVRLITPSHGDRVATIDEYGNFGFSGLVNGDYSILIEKDPQYETSNTPFNISQQRGFPAMQAVLNIRLSYKKGVTPKPPAVINAALASVPKPALDLYNQALDKAKQGDSKAAIQLFEDAIKVYPQFPDAYNDMGVQYLKLRDMENADIAFKAARMIDPTAYGPTMNDGMALYYLKRYAEAATVLRDAIKMKSDQPGPHFFLGQTLAYMDSFDEAETELTTAVGMAPQQTVEAYRLLAIIHSSKGKKKEAAEDLEEYLKLNPTTPDADNLRETIKKFRASS